MVPVPQVQPSCSHKAKHLSAYYTFGTLIFKRFLETAGIVCPLKAHRLCVMLHVYNLCLGIILFHKKQF